ncbi:putative tyrosine carboxypeptidase MATCAP2 isoform X1 [Poeciliopsis prolifica]|uniref:putative tyrosine carboxypeptidase MATCAP2 isoform X1 n=1 Tax=Poeciliopsis prolifica TaxID=188132 RepID=UPI0024145860|nr:putative tyrosine carboxypeptidase MATCAP2 isoform X1 [Poeciliopsis prolifica]
MLESIKVTEQLQWPEVDLSKKSIFNSVGRVVSPNQVCFATFPSPVLEDLLLQAKEEEKKQKAKESQCKRPKSSMKGGLALSKRNCVILAQKQTHSPDGDEKPVQTNCVHSYRNCNLLKPTLSLTVAGSKMELTPRTVSLLRKNPSLNAYRSVLSSPYNAAASREVENTKKLCIFTAIKPCNVDREKDKFFKSDFSYNPQFEYSSPASAGFLARHNHASDQFLAQAVNIMELALKRYGNYEMFEQVTGGDLLPRSRIWISVKRYMEKEGCVGEIVVQVTDDLLSRASMTMVNGQPTMTINTSSAREYWLEGMLRHEIGTHYFRGLNNCQQPWGSSTGRRKHNLKPLNPTEEGLASIHSVLFRKDPTLWRAALLYYTVYQARHTSFTQLFRNLGRFVQDPHTRWDYCVRAKRGQTNTALPGCFSKDQVYLEGILQILRYRDKINFPMLMALGKVSFEDVDRLTPLAQMDKVRIPHFMQDQEKYAEQLTKIMVVNQLTDEELKTLI